MGLLAPGRIYPGSTIRITGEFLDTEDTDTDPTTSVVFKLRSPLGVETSYTYLTDEEVQKASTGNYTADIRPDSGGRWRYRWEATTVDGITIYVAGEGSFVVQASQFTGYDGDWDGGYSL